MSTRAQLESEREVLSGCRERAYIALNRPLYEALNASIARIDALLSLSDEQCAYYVEVASQAAVSYATGAAVDAQYAAEFRAEGNESRACDYDREGARATMRSDAHRTVADLVRRS